MLKLKEERRGKESCYKLSTGGWEELCSVRWAQIEAAMRAHNIPK